MFRHTQTTSAGHGRPIRFAGYLLALLALMATNVGAAQLSVLRVLPSGDDVPPARQILIGFDRPMVPIGNMARDAAQIPITVAPDPGCEWRWLDVENLACQLTDANALRPATRYVITIGTQWTALDGTTLAKQQVHTFTTIRPQLDYQSFSGWLGPERPQLRLRFNQPVVGQSLAQAVTIRRPGADPVAVVVAPTNPEATDNPDVTNDWKISPRTALDPNRRYSVHIAPGVRSGIGTEASVSEHDATQFDTFPQPAFLGIRCLDGTSDKSVLLSALAPDSRQCDPMQDVALAFSTPIVTKDVASRLNVQPNFAPELKADKWGAWSDGAHLRYSHTAGTEYLVWFPAHLRPDTAYHIAMSPGAMNDAFERPLLSGIDMKFSMAHRRPGARLTHSRAVLEAQIDSAIPLWVTNLDRIKATFRRQTPAGASGPTTVQSDVPSPVDIPTPTPLGVRQMLGASSGVVSGTLQTVPPDSRRGTQDFFAIVSPYHVHAKIGHFSSLVWVTDFSTGEPVANASVTLYPDSYKQLAGPAQPLATATTDKDGLATLPGAATVDPKRELLSQWAPAKNRLMVEVRRDDNIGVLPLDYAFRVNDRSQWPTERKQYGHLRVWGTTAQGIYRAGDTIQYKLYVRNQDDQGLIAAPRTSYQLTVTDPSGKNVLERDHIQLSEFGTVADELTLPPKAAIGWYVFRLKPSFASQQWTALRVLVTDFTPAPFRVSTDLNGTAFSPNDTVKILTRAALHSGGPYTGGQTRITARVRAARFSPDHPVAKKFHFSSNQGVDRAWHTLLQGQHKLDDKGEYTVDLPLTQSDITYGELEVESVVRDERGKNTASRAKAAYLGRDRYVGLRSTRWLYPSNEIGDFESIVVDAQQRPVAGVSQQITLERLRTRASRVKSAGNTYSTKYVHDWVKADACLIVSSALASTCKMTPPQAGTYRVSAEVVDTAGRTHRSELRIWVTGPEEVVWEQPANATLPMTPEQTKWAVGDTARVLIRNPFPGARALITVERYGVLSRWVETLDGSTPVIEFPITADLIPGFYLSVAVVSPRIAQTAPLGKIDLGKPAHRLGYLKFEVNDPAKRIDIAVSTAQEQYKPRDKVTVDIATTLRHDADDPQVALA
ncbi:MAG: large extracellular alpha-helical protein, partial [Gammaproteobacteria bacterium]|nr:large extracellular alpha-helical protein [Gammaproteobacteria bacterium]